MNIGLFGGTFDPPHVGHLIVAQDALVALGLDRVLFVPAASPPHKPDRRTTAPGDRLRMVELAVSGDGRFSVDRLELERGGASYTVDTLEALCRRSPASRWTLLMGADQYAEFGTWRGPDRIREMARIAVLTRHGSDGTSAVAAEAARSLPAPVELDNGDIRVEVTRIDISATAIRARVGAGLSIRYLVASAVESYIHERRLYSETAAERRGSTPDHANRG